MIYELRIYTINPGKMENIKNRFKEKALSLLKKHNLVVIDFWQDLNEEKIYYMVQHDDVESRKRNFDSFFNDLEWHETKRISELDGPLVKKSEYFLMSHVHFDAIRNARN